MSSTNDNDSYLRHLTESDMAQMISGDAVRHMGESDMTQMISGDVGVGGGSVTATHAMTTLQEDSAGTAASMAFHHTMEHTMEVDGDDDNRHILPHPLPKKTADSSPELEAMIRGLRQELDAVIQVNKVETDRMFDEMVIFLQDSHAICTDTMLGHLDFEHAEANRLTGMEPDVDAATVSLVGNHHHHGQNHNM
jgi:hypothetical protein